MNLQLNLQALTASKPFRSTVTLLGRIARPIVLLGAAVIVLGIALLMRFGGREMR